jgi:hypothetical protein
LARRLQYRRYFVSQELWLSRPVIGNSTFVAQETEALADQSKGATWS